MQPLTELNSTAMLIIIDIRFVERVWAAMATRGRPITCDQSRRVLQHLTANETFEGRTIEEAVQRWIKHVMLREGVSEIHE